jgi:hypothetical protein
MKVIRQADNETLDNSVTLTVNDNDPTRGGFVQTYSTRGNIVTAVLKDFGMKDGKQVPVNTWKVKVIFSGDDANQASMVENTFSK